MRLVPAFLGLALLAASPAGAQPACTPRSFCTADADGDGGVGLSDFALLSAQFGGHSTRGASADFDADGWVGLADLALLVSQFGRVCPGDCPPNTPLDFDQDGAFDFVACGDWNGDGQLTMDLGCPNADPTTGCDAEGDKSDLLACLESLDDADGRILEILPGRYEVPDAPFTAHNAPSIGPDAGLLELPSNTRVHCHPGAVLTGTDERHLDPTDQMSVLFVPVGVSHAVIEGCEIDQGWPDGQDCANGACFPVTRMGVLLYGNDSVVRENHIHHTRHSCIYTKRGARNLLQNNRLDWCGAAWSVTKPIAHYPGVYAYSDYGKPTLDLRVLGTECDRTGAPCINTRLSGDDERGRIANLYVAGTRHVATGTNADGTVPECMRLRGLDDALVVDTWCENTSGLHVVGGEGRYRDDPGCNTSAGTWGQCVNASLGLEIRDATIVAATGDAPFSLGAWSVDVRAENVTIQGSDVDRRCVNAPGPFRGLAIDGLAADDCGAGGVALGNASQPGDWGEADPAEAVSLANVEIHTADADLTDGVRGVGLALLQGCVGCRFTDLLVEGWTEYGLWVGAGRAFRDNLVSGVTLEMEGSWYAGTSTAAALPPCDAALAGSVYTLVDAAAPNSCSGGGGASNLCVCDGTLWRDTDAIGATRVTSPGIFLADSNEVRDNTLEHLTCRDARSQGHCVELPGFATGNTVSDLWAEDTRGLQAWNPNAPDANNGALDLNGATDTLFEDVVCQGLRNDEVVDGRRCVCMDAGCTW